MIKVQIGKRCWTSAFGRKDSSGLPYLPFTQTANNQTPIDNLESVMEAMQKREAWNKGKLMARSHPSNRKTSGLSKVDDALEISARTEI